MGKKKGQAVFLASILGFALIIVFFLALPVITNMIAQGKAQINQPFVMLLMDFIPFLMFIIILFVVLKFARSE